MIWFQKKDKNNVKNLYFSLKDCYKALKLRINLKLKDFFYA